MKSVETEYCPDCGAPLGSPLCAGCGRTTRARTLDESTALEEAASDATADAEPDTLNEVPSVGAEETEAQSLVAETSPEDDRQTVMEGVRVVRRMDIWPPAVPTERNPAVPSAPNFFDRAAAPPTERNPAVPSAPNAFDRADAPPTERHQAVERTPSLRAPELPQPSAIAPPAPVTEDLAAVPPEPRTTHAEDVGTQVTRMPLPIPIRDEVSRFLLAGLWISSVIGAVLVTDYLARSDAPIELGSTSLRYVEPSRVIIEKSSFRQGLNEEVRATIITACLQVQPDAADCDEKVLLGGEYPEKSVAVASYSIDTLEVSVGEYAGCVDAGGCKPIAWRDCKVYTLQGLQSALRAPRSMQHAASAATCVTQAEAAAFCAWRSGRLPTHDEWERAARGTDGRIYPWGSVWKADAANWGELDVLQTPVPGKIDGAERAHAPGQYPEGVSPVGAFDMAGNVAEWVGDEPAARGGSWISNPFDLRVTGRLHLKADARRTDVGFRCVY